MEIDEFVGRTLVAAPMAPANPWRVYGALLSGLLSLGLGAFALLGDLGGSLVVPVLGYVLGGLIGPAFVALHRVAENSRAKSPNYAVLTGRARLMVVSTLVTVTGATANAWLVATELAKR